MVIQSLSVAVPAPCPNACGFCVSRMHSEDYPDHIEKNKRFRETTPTAWPSRATTAATASFSPVRASRCATKASWKKSPT